MTFNFNLISTLSSSHPHEPSPIFMTAPLPSTAMTHALKRQTYADDCSPPHIYELIKIKLPNPLNGPTSITIATSSVSSTRDLPGRPAGYPKKRSYSAIVHGFAIDSMSKLLVIDVWPVPAYSNAIAEGYVSSTNWVMAQPTRDHHIPIPCLGDSVAMTPEAFGDPLNVGGYQDRKPSWVFLQSQRIHIPFNTTWKRFDPPVYLSKAEGERLNNYHTFLEEARNNITNSTSTTPRSTLPTPIPSTGDATFLSSSASPLSSGGGAGANPNIDGSYYQQRPVGVRIDPQPSILDVFSRGKMGVAIVCPNSDDDSNSDSGSDADDAGIDPVDYARIWAPYDPLFASIVDKHEATEKERKDGMVRGWIDGIHHAGEV